MTYSPDQVKPGDMAVATDDYGDHYCLFMTRRADENAWEVLSLRKKVTLIISDQQFLILVRNRNLRPC